MQLIVVIAAHRDRKFIADLAAERPGLSKFEMVRVAGLALANHTRVCPNKRQVSFAPSSERSIQQSIGFGGVIIADVDHRFPWSLLFGGRYRTAI